ncbi:hypothetical protein Bca4012_019811 [Brassica carinata]
MMMVNFCGPSSARLHEAYHQALAAHAFGDPKVRSSTDKHKDAADENNYENCFSLCYYVKFR